jgi:signal transduction histidine kinase
MKLSTYLNFGTALVFLILTAMTAANWYSANRVGQQHDAYLTDQADLQKLDDLQSSVHRIVSSVNEYALISLSAKDRGTSSGESVTEALAAEKALIASATEAFRSAHGAIALSAGEQSDAFMRVGSGFQSLLAINASLLDSLDATDFKSADMFDIKEQQEAAEMELLDGIEAEQLRVRNAIHVRSDQLSSFFELMKKYTLAGGAIAALVLLASARIISRRIKALFTQVGDQRLNIEKANVDLNAALLAMQNLQQDLVTREKFATLGRLTATVSHELRNPLAAIRNCTFIIRQSLSKVPELADFVSRIERNITRCDHIIADLLEYSRTRPLCLASTNLVPWLRKFTQDHDVPAGVTLKLDLPAEPVSAQIDDARFVRAIINLVENAQHAIVATGQPGTITVSCGAEAEGSVISVRDDGPGIAPAVASRIFEPLFTTKNFGAGLGLSITKNLVAQHGGRIDLATRPGEGTTFTIHLPRAFDQTMETTAA